MRPAWAVTAWGNKVLKIALLGARHTEANQLAVALNGALDGSIVLVALVLADGVASHIALSADWIQYDLILLLGLQSPAPSPELAARQQAADQSIRAALALSGLAYRVIYGDATERQEQALREIRRLLPPEAQAAGLLSPPQDKPKPWVWACDKCSDPSCEHRLLSDLLASRLG